MIDVELRHLSKRFKEVVAVDDVNLQIAHGEFLFLLGPSGCGKTTTLRIIGGLDEPTEGAVFIQGVDVSGLPPERRDTATVFQRWALFPHKTVFANVAFGLQMRKRPRSDIRATVARFLEMVGLAGLADRYPAQLSGGQKQRVALARALVVEPAVLLLDEPLSALDLKLRQQMRFEIRRIQKALAVTTIFVTHDQTEALAMADRIVIMNQGRVEQIGTPHEIYFNPASKFTSDFIGETNFLTGRVERVDGDLLDVALDQGALLQAVWTGDTPPAGQVVVGVRPERLALHAAPPVEAANVLEGRVQEVTFMGATQRYHVQFGSQVLVVEDVSGMRRAMRYREAEQVFASVEPQDCLVLPG